MLYERPPGMRGHAVRIVAGRRSRAELRRIESGWVFVDGAGVEHAVNAAEAIALVHDGVFKPRRVHIRPEIAPILFKQAVERAQDSVNRINRVTASRKQADKDPLWLYLMNSHELDEAVASALVSTTSAVAAAEAQLNDWAEERSWPPPIGDRGVDFKLAALAAEYGHTIALGSGVMQKLRVAIDRRNDIMHGSLNTVDLPLVGGSSPAPGTTESLAARETCRVVRHSLILVASKIDAQPPTYLAYCPDVPPEDTNTWQSAVVLTGVRDDPVFPKAGEPSS